MKEKVIIFDAGALISFGMNGIVEIIRDLKGVFKGHFIVTQKVKEEIIDKPIKIKRFELEALRLKELLDEGILELPDSLGIKQGEINKRAQDYLDIVNSTFVTAKKSVHLIELGEASCLALSNILHEKGIKNIIAIDERTMRSFIETPGDLRKFLQKKLHTKITPKLQNYKQFQKIKMIRSAELIYVAYKKGLIKRDFMMLDALLYAVKFKGCSISGEEIREIEKLA